MFTASLALALLFLLSAGPAGAAGGPASDALWQAAGQNGPNLIDFSRFKRVKPTDDAPSAPTTPITVVPLAPLLDGMRQSPATFSAGGLSVHVFGAQSINDKSLKSWFLELYPDGADAPIFLNGKAMARWLFGSASAHVQINGLDYDLHVNANLSHSSNSELVIEPRQAGEPVTAFTLAQLSAAAAQTGAPVMIAGSPYRVLYTSDFLSNNGQFAGYSGGRSVVLMYDTGNGDYDALRFDAAELAGGGYVAKMVNSLKVGLRLDAAQNLEIYYPIP